MRAHEFRFPAFYEIDEKKGERRWAEILNCEAYAKFSLLERGRGTANGGEKSNGSSANHSLNHPMAR
jgi:hypothetical protein